MSGKGVACSASSWLMRVNASWSYSYVVTTPLGVLTLASFSRLIW